MPFEIHTPLNHPINVNPDGSVMCDWCGGDYHHVITTIHIYGIYKFCSPCWELSSVQDFVIKLDKARAKLKPKEDPYDDTWI